MDPQVVAAIVGAVVGAVSGALAGGLVAALQARSAEQRASVRETWSKRLHETRQNIWAHGTYRRNEALGWSVERQAAVVKVVPGRATFPQSDFSLVGDIRALRDYASALADLQARGPDGGPLTELEELRLDNALHSVRIGLDRNQSRVDLGKAPVRADWPSVKRSIDPESSLFPLD